MPAIALGVAWAETGTDVLALAAELERATGSADLRDIAPALMAFESRLSRISRSIQD
jgi:hypothetical protein